jgi:TRAP-type C4-dicarboxylate transport system permease small subunit
MTSILRLATKAGIIFDYAIKSLIWVACAFLTFAILAVSVDVVLRYFFNRPTTWVLEICEYILLYIVFLGAAWVLKEEGHVRVGLVVDRLNPKTQAVVSVITSIVGAFVCSTLAWYGARITWDHFLRGVPSIEMLHLPQYLILMIIPIGSFLLFVQFLRRSYGYLNTWRLLHIASKEYKATP